MPKDWSQTQQLDTVVLRAFDIELLSRDGKADEMVQMLHFARTAADNNVAHYVKGLYYDSPASTCYLSFHAPLQDGDPLAGLLCAIACETLDQFAWFDEFLQGGEFARFCEPEEAEAENEDFE